MNLARSKSRLKLFLIGPLLFGMLVIDFFRKLKWNREETIICPFGTEHLPTDQLCTCGIGKNDRIVAFDGGLERWSGGFWDLERGIALQPCSKMHPDAEEITGQFHLNEEEQALIKQWRNFSADVVETLGRRAFFRYEVLVRMGDSVFEIMSRTQGMVEPTEPFRHKDKN